MTLPTEPGGAEGLDEVPTAGADPARAGLADRPEEAPAPQGAPRRYFAAGCGSLVTFVALSGFLAMRTGESVVGELAAFAQFLPGSPIGDGPDLTVPDLPLEQQIALARLREAAEELECLGTFDWDHPNQECRARVLPLAHGFEALVAQVGELPPGEVGLTATLRTAGELGQSLPLLVVIEAAPGPAPANIEFMLARTARLAQTIARDLAPFERAANLPEGLERDPIGTGLKVMTGQDPTGEVELPGVEPRRVGAPRPIADAEEDDDEPPVAATPASTPGTPRVVAPPPSTVVEPLRGALTIYEGCARSVDAMPICIQQVRDMLDAAEERLAAYRAGARTGEATDRATGFSRLADAAIGKLRRATVAYSTAANTAGPGADSLVGDPFAEGDGLLREASTAIHAADAALASAPP